MKKTDQEIIFLIKELIRSINEERNNSEFISEEDVRRLTQTKYKLKQIDCLRKNGILFFTSAHGNPVVPKTAINGGKINNVIETKSWTPNVIKNTK